MSTNTPAKRWVLGFYLAVGLLSFSSLLAELALTRLFSLLLWYHFAFLAISLALTGLSAGAIAVYLRSSLRPAREAIFRSCLVAAVALAVISPILLSLSTTEQIDAVMLAKIILACVVAAVPYLFIGAGLAHAMQSAGERVSAVYAADLAGAAAACLLFVPLADHLGVPLVMSVAAIACGMGALIASADGGRRMILAAAVLGLVVTAVWGQRAAGLTDVRFVKGKARSDREVRWNSFSRVGVWWFDEPEPFSRGVSSRFQGSTEAERLIIDIDAGANTPVVRAATQPADLDYLRHDLTSLPFEGTAVRDTLVIGPGGGRDVVLSLLYGAEQVVGVEINPAIIDLVKNRFGPYAGGLYDRPEVRVVIRDGRSFLHSTEQCFDLIMLSLVDTFAASAAGALSLTENMLYTSEAFDQYLKHLTPDGVLAFTRWVWEPDRETIRLVGLARGALERMGVENPANHLMVIREKNLGSVMVARQPWSEERIAAVERRAAELGFEPLYLPGRDLAGPIGELLSTQQAAEFYARYPFDIRPPTDNRPFFFFTLWPADVFRVLSMPQGRAQNIGVLVLLVVAATVSVLAVAAIGLPLAIKGRRRESRRAPVSVPALAGYFAALGLGFMLVEIPLIQSFTIFLGQPAAALTVVLFSILLGTAIGSWSTRGSRVRARRLWIVFAVLLILAVAIRIAGDALLPTLAHWPMFMRAAAVIAGLLPLGMCLGVFFPSGLTVVSRVDVRLVPWALGINAICSVLGSVLAMGVGLIGGFNVALAAGLLCYLLALAAFPRLNAATAAGDLRSANPSEGF